MTNNHLLIYRLAELMLENQQHIMPLDDLFEDEQIGSFVRSIQIDSPYQQLIFEGVLTETIKEERVMVTFTVEGYFHYVLGEVIEQQTLDKEAKALKELLENNQLRGITEGVEQCLVRDVEKNDLSRLMWLIDEGGQALEASAYPLAQAFLIHPIERVMDELLADPTDNDIEVLERAIKRLLENQNNQVTEKIYHHINETLAPKTPREIKLLVKGIKCIEEDKRLQKLELLFEQFSKLRFRNPLKRFETLGEFGMAYYNLNEYTKSISILKKCISVITTRKFNTVRTEIGIRVTLVMSLVGKCIGAPKDISEAAEHLQKAQDLSEKNNLSDYNSTILALSGAIQLFSFSKEEAVQKMRSSIEEAERNYGLYHPITAKCYYGCAKSLQSISIKEAEEMAIQSLQIEQNLYKEGHPSTASAIELLGEIYTVKGNQDKAHEYLSGSLEINIRNNGMQHQSTALSYLAIGDFYIKNEEFEDAIKNLTSSLEIQKKIRKDPNPLMARTYTKLALAEMMNLNFNECLNHSKQALNHALHHNEGNPEIVTLLNSIALAYFFAGDLENSLLYYEKELVYRKKLFHKEIKAIVKLITRIVGMCSESNKTKKAIDYGSEGLKLGKKLAESEKYLIPDLHNRIGVAYFKQSDYKNAEKHYQKAIGLHKKHETFEKLYQVYRNLALLNQNRGKYKKSIDFYTRSYQLNSKYHGTKSEEALTDKTDIALVYAESGDYSKARQLQEKILNSVKDSEDGIEYEELRSNLRWDLAQTYMGIKDYKKALPLLKENFKIHPDQGGYPFYIGHCYEKLKDYQKAIKNYSLSAELRKSHLGIDAHGTQEAIQNAIRLAKETNNIKLLPKWIKELNDQ
jgi:tetratricopeptide (TPR) repeat protein